MEGMIAGIAPSRRGAENPELHPPIHDDTRRAVQIVVVRGHRVDVSSMNSLLSLSRKFMFFSPPTLVVCTLRVRLTDKRTADIGYTISSSSTNDRRKTNQPCVPCRSHTVRPRFMKKSMDCHHE
ncbi:hypothetical protein DICVIV_10483 [Dictyocaulus viviparus]|uniref:Uncharacterized protein n=1 Tax=Dictyocaulus viviparus TaxID=29172 RepID=A0A0D8XFY3_DICVI|nr:hypothetical protein DICVIV_10483 [Dictyocaulus viviparus]